MGMEGVICLKNSMGNVFQNAQAPFLTTPTSIKNHRSRGTWVAQLVKRLTSAQVMISWFVSSSPASGSVPPAQSLEPASDSVFPSLSAPPHPFSLKNKHEKY